jgi:hypothetical protein
LNGVQNLVSIRGSAGANDDQEPITPGDDSIPVFGRVREFADFLRHGAKGNAGQG